MSVKELTVVASLLFWSAVAMGQPLDAQSRYTPTGPPPEEGYQPYDIAVRQRGQVVIPNVPDYQWHHGCGPTAAGMVIGYWDGQGFDRLIPGDASTQTAAVNQAITSGDVSGADDCAVAGNGHFEDYSCPKDYAGTPPGLLPDKSSLGGAHASDSLGDFMMTSWYSQNNYYGWSWFSDVDDSLLGYTNYANTTYGASYVANSWSEDWWGEFTWEKFKAEIDAGRPMVFLVDTNSDGSTDHFVTVIGYRDTSGEYGCLDTWAPPGNVRWEQFRELSSLYNWGIYGATYFMITGADPTPKWSQLPHNTGEGFDEASDYWWNEGPSEEEVNKVVADDFMSDGQPVGPVRWWGSYLDELYEPLYDPTEPHILDGWFISFHHDDVQNQGCPPGLDLGDSHPTALGIYHCPSEVVTWERISLDCLAHWVYEYTVDLDSCCLLCSEPDPRTSYYPAQPEGFFEQAGLWYWLDIQAVVGVTWEPPACDYSNRILTGHMPSAVTADGHFWGWHTSPEVNRYEACAGNIYDRFPYPPACWDYGEWVTPPWQCQTTPEPVNMAFELYPRPCPPPDPPTQPAGEAGHEKIRYISMVPGNPGVHTALRVTLTNLPAPFDGFNGTKMWVGPPRQVSENAGKVDPIADWPNFASANLQCEPECMDWNMVGVLHVTDDDIIPGAVYSVQVIDCNCSFGNEGDYSAPLVITTSRWGDLVRNCATCPCPPPDGTVGIPTDVTACLDKFKNLRSPTILCDYPVLKSRADIEPNFPDWLVNIADVTEVLDTFRGCPYSNSPLPPCRVWTGPSGCP